MKDFFLPILIGCIGSTGLFTFITFLINRRDDKESKLNDIYGQIHCLQERQKEYDLSQLRTELLILMNHYKNDEIEIMKLAERYFKDLGGDFYMTSLFNKWLKKHGIDNPPWFNMH